MNQCKRTKRRTLAIGAATAAAAMLLAGPASAADQFGNTTTTGAICMQRVFMGQSGTVSGATQLNCTANDVRLSMATSAINLDNNSDFCVKDTTFNLRATFQTVVTATSRYDETYFFRLDGGPNARGDGVNATGTCSVTQLGNLGVANTDPGSNLDGDTCGDLNAGTYSFTVDIPGVKCEAATGTTVLKLPNCTSWHNNAGTVCTAGNPFTSQPDTKSKCTCDDTFTIPIHVIAASIVVGKTGSPSSVPETGGTVTYTVTMTNSAPANSGAILTIDTINDNIYGNLGTNTPPYNNNTCPSLIGTTLAAQASTSCHFDAFVQQAFVLGGNNSVTDTATVCGHDNGSNPTSGSLCDHHDFTVTITDVATEPGISKTATAAAVQSDVTFTVVVTNKSSDDTLTINSLVDNKFGDITTVHDVNTACGGLATCEAVTTTNCATGGLIASGGANNYSCQFVGRIITSLGSTTHTNHVTATSTDGDGHQFSDTSAPDTQVTISVTSP